MEHPKKLYILWTSGEAVTAEKMVMMYATNSLKHHWWNEVEVIIWGAASPLAANNAAVAAAVAAAQRAGVQFSACKACADQLGTADALLGMGVDVRYYGAPLTELLKNGEHLLTV